MKRILYYFHDKNTLNKQITNTFIMCYTYNRLYTHIITRYNNIFVYSVYAHFDDMYNNNIMRLVYIVFIRKASRTGRTTYTMIMMMAHYHHQFVHIIYMAEKKGNNY